MKPTEAPRAAIKMGKLLKAAQDAGVLAKRGRPKKSTHEEHCAQEGDDEMRGRACSVEFMRRLKRLADAGNGRKHKELVKFLANQTCLTPQTVRQNLRALELKEKISDIGDFQSWPSLLAECLSAPDPLALATQAIEEGWTAKQTREEAKARKQTHERAEHGRASVEIRHCDFRELLASLSDVDANVT